MNKLAWISVYIVGYVIYYLWIRHLFSKDGWKVSDRTLALLMGVVWPLSCVWVFGVLIKKSLQNDSKAKW